MRNSLPAIPTGRVGQLVLGADPGAHMGFALVDTNPTLAFHCVRRSPVIAMTTQIEVAAGWIRELGADVIALIEDQYRGVASQASRTTLSQRAGHISGFFAGAGMPEQNIVFVTPQAWYKGIGAQGLTKAVCLNRVERALDPDERTQLELLCGIDGAYPENRLDVLAAVGIAWSFPFLSASTLSRGQKMSALKPRTPRPASSVGRRAKAKKRVAARKRGAKVKEQ
jgi:hypothetical protein